MTSLIGMTTYRSVKVDTRLGNPIENNQDHTPPAVGTMAQVAAFKKQYVSGTTHRDTEPTDVYNCHGLTFAARRTRIWKPESVKNILSDDGYVPVRPSEVQPGDIIIYSSPDDGDIAHSGVVVESNSLTPRILSKWGSCHEVVHPANSSPYNGYPITFFRMKK